jgi:hypothetical protein
VRGPEMKVYDPNTLLDTTYANPKDLYTLVDFEEIKKLNVMAQ